MITTIQKITLFHALAFLASGAAVAGVGWTFDGPGDLQGWRPNGKLVECGIVDGALRARTTGDDAFMESPAFRAPASEYGSILVRMKVEAGGGGPPAQPSVVQVFWRTDASPGDREEASGKAEILRDGRWHEYEIPVAGNPEWKGEITGLRLDPCVLADVRVSIASVRLLPPVKTMSAAGFAPEAPVAATGWVFGDASHSQGWQPNDKLGGCEVREGALTALATGGDPFWSGPPLRAPTGEYGVIHVRMRLQNAEGGPLGAPTHAQIYWTTDGVPQIREAASIHFQTLGDGEWHDYRVAVAGHAEWKGAITALRLDPCTIPEVRVSVERIALEPMVAVAEWDFSQAADFQGWMPQQDLGECEIKDGALTAQSTGNDPFWRSPPFRVPAANYKAVLICMKLEPKTGKHILDPTPAQLFWSTDARPGDHEEAAAVFETWGSGKWEEYEMPMGGGEWTGNITGLRFDPCQWPDIRVSIKSIRLVSVDEVGSRKRKK